MLVVLAVLYLIPSYLRFARDKVGRKMARKKYWKLVLFTFFLVTIVPSKSRFG